MKLYYAAPSPFARKARLMVLEKGLETQIEMEVALPFGEEDKIRAQNPLGKIPVLIREEGPILMESLLICQYIDSLADPRLIPTYGTEAYWEAMRLHALANGVMDATMNVAVEGRREAAEGTPAARSPTFHARYVSAIKLGLDALEAETFSQEPDLVTLTVGTMLEYIDLRASADLDWRDGHPKLTVWHAEFGERPAMVATRPDLA